MMGNLQETLNSLQPYVSSISYVSNKPVVVAKFKDGWILPESKFITKVKGTDDTGNYYIYSEQEGIGLDEVLDYVRVVINVNIEREKKHMLLKDKIEELKTLFKKHTLTELTKLRFVLTEELLIQQSHEIELHEIDPVEIPTLDNVQISQRPVVPNITEVPQIPDEQPTPEIELTEDDLEVLAEERRAENYRMYKQQQNEGTPVRKHQKVELPPRTKQREMAYANDCNCAEDEACEKCIDSKGY